ncbi:hypothetical protein D3C72_2289640 [compost metagenome]
MMVEVTCGQRNVDIARFADRLTVVDRLDHRDQARMALDHAGKGIEVTGTGMARQLGPRALRFSSSSDRVIHVLGAAKR